MGVTISDPGIHTEPRSPWERQPGEKIEDFEAFRIYRDLGPSRDYITVADKTGRPPNKIAWCAQKNAWNVRCQAFDMFEDRQLMERNRIAIQEMHARHALYAKQALDVAMDAILKYLDKAKKGLMRDSDAIKLFSQAIKLERLSRGEPETIESVEIQSVESKRHQWRKILEDPEAVAQVQLIADRLDELGGNGNGQRH